MADHTGQQLGNYRLVRRLGGGGFADVYLGQHIRISSQQAAIKVLHLTDVDKELFQHEAERTAALRHPNIVRLYDFDIRDGIPFLVLEYAPSGSLARHKGQRLPMSDILQYLRQIAPALQYAHDSGVIHRDIKPDNILIGSQGELLISDFGISVISKTGRTSIQSPYSVSGTPYYMAPEMYRGKPERASDQYALAIMMYGWLCGKLPFTEGDFIGLGYQHAHEPVPAMHEQGFAVPSEVEAVVMTALAKDVGQRFGSVRAFAVAFEQASEATRPFPGPIVVNPSFTRPSPPELPVAVPPTSSTTPPISTSSQDKSQSEPRPVLTPSDLVMQPLSQQGQPNVQPLTPPAPLAEPLLQSMPVPTSLYGNQPATQIPWEPISEVPAAQSVRPQPPRHGISRRAVIIGLGVMAGVGVAGGGIALLASLNVPLGTTLYIYRGHTQAVHSAVWSPDGKRIASASDDTTVQVWNAGDGSSVLTYHGHAYAVNAVAWSPDGKRIASASSDTTVQVWNAGDGSSVLTYSGHANAVNAVAWSPDGIHIASAGADNTVQIWDAGNGSGAFTYQGHPQAVHSVAWSPDGIHIASASDDHTVQVWNAGDGSGAFTYSGHPQAVISVAWSPDGKRIASASDDHTVQIWNASDGSSAFIYRGHTEFVYAVAWSPDGKRIASASDDTTVQVWNAGDGSGAFTYSGHPQVVNSAVWSPDGKRIASASYDTTVQVWEGA